ncbi:hypothetical protein GZH47_31525 (plasmid) [Paenibacillus rhizovicinus]|uniref:DUF4320 family protein n=1 Tax=Paenibacillus rhizovicinus TaxID=2704463 RepID=A0A6C0PAM5_9BACL|nr:hypothetical protein [Paenibacillus rhizovicinus]QHW35431.1 hypothetical protein GZH47_31525 [Paenibacillus rhizovicinus]
MLLGRLLKPIRNEKGISNLIVLLIVLPIFFGVTVMIATTFLYVMRQAKLDDIKDRALQMVETSGYLSPAIQNDIKNKMAQLGYPAVTKNGISYPYFTGSTLTKVGKFDADPTVKLVIQYPATDLAKIMIFFGVDSTEDPGYFYIEEYGRSEEK